LEKAFPIAELLVALAPAPHVPVACADDLGLYHVTFPAIARNITSCTFIARSIAAFE